MPSGTDFKYSTGDTTAWKSKYYAFVDYALSVGASVADIEAFLAENSDFNPGTAPTALASLNAVNATTSDNLEYKITHGTPYTSLTANLWFLVRMPSANAGAMTLKVDALAAKAVYFAGAATTGGEFSSGLLYFLAYNATSDRFDAFGPQIIPIMGLRKVTVHNSNGTHNFQSWMKRFRVTVIGAGGGGAGDTTTGGYHGTPGAGGGFAQKFVATPYATISSGTVTVGGGGSGGGLNGWGGNGGSSSWSDGTNTVTGNGGQGGRPQTGGTDVRAGGSASGGDLNVPGGDSSSVYGRAANAGSAFWGPSGAAFHEDGGIGAGGGAGNDNQTSGGAGGDGVVIVEEFG